MERTFTRHLTSGSHTNVQALTPLGREGAWTTGTMLEFEIGMETATAPAVASRALFGLWVWREWVISLWVSMGVVRRMAQEWP